MLECKAISMPYPDKIRVVHSHKVFQVPHPGPRHELKPRVLDDGKTIITMNWPFAYRILQRLRMCGMFLRKIHRLYPIVVSGLARTDILL